MKFENYKAGCDSMIESQGIYELSYESLEILQAVGSNIVFRRRIEKMREFWFSLGCKSHKCINNIHLWSLTGNINYKLMRERRTLSN